MTSAPLQLSLSEAIDRGLTHNLGMIAAEQQIESARGARLRSLRDLLPHVDTRAGETRQTTNLAAFGFDPSLLPGLPSIVGPFNIFDARVFASQPVFDLGAINDLRSKTSALALTAGQVTCHENSPRTRTTYSTSISPTIASRTF